MRWPKGHRGSPVGQRPTLIVDPVALDLADHRALVAGHVVHLPAREAAILGVLMSSAGQVLAARELQDAVGLSPDDPRQVAKLVRRLSRRLTVSPLLPSLIERVGPDGYRFTSIGSGAPGER